MKPARAVALAAHALGQPAGSLRLLQADAAVTLAVEDRIVRVMGPVTATGLPVAAWARLLAAISPVFVAPLEPPHLLADAAVVVFPRLPLDGSTHLDAAAAGAALARLHADGAAWADDPALPRFDPVALADTWLAGAQADIAEELIVRTRASLVEAWDRVTGPVTVLHGDAHAGNWRGDTGGAWRLVDAEYLSVGPAVYDLAPLEVVERRLAGDVDRFPTFRRAYVASGNRLDENALAAAIRTRELLSATWYAAREADPGRVCRRLEDAVAGAPGAWQPLGDQD